ARRINCERASRVYWPAPGVVRTIMSEAPRSRLPVASMVRALVSRRLPLTLALPPLRLRRLRCWVAVKLAVAAGAMVRVRFADEELPASVLKLMVPALREIDALVPCDCGPLRLSVPLLVLLRAEPAELSKRAVTV